MENQSLQSRIKTIVLKPITWILIITFFSRLIFLFNHHPIWWDEAVYCGMAKQIFSLGNIGLWEPYRPLILPFILGIILKSGLPVFLTFRFMEIILSTASVYLIYKITKDIFNKNTAIISSILLSTSTLFFFFNFRVLTEVISSFFALFAIYLYLKQKHVWSGILFSLAFLTKFPAGIFFGIIILVESYHYFIKKQNIKSNIIRIAIGFLIPTFLYLLANTILYKNPLYPFLYYMQIIDKVVACIYIFPRPWYYYFILLLKQSFLYIFSLLGIFILLKNSSSKRSIILFSCLIPLIYFSTLLCKTIRYPIIFIPFLIILSAVGIDFLIHKLKNIFKILIIIIIFLFSLYSCINYYIENEPISSPDQEFYMFLEDRSIDGEVLTTTPLVALSADAKLNLMYHPIYNSTLAKHYTEYIKNNKDQISYIFITTRDLVCPPPDEECESATQQLLETINSNFEIEYEKQVGGSELLIYS